MAEFSNDFQNVKFFLKHNILKLKYTLIIDKQYF